jgi:putative hydrolase
MIGYLPASAGWLRERLAADGHVHSTFSDGASDLAANLGAGIAAGLVDMVMTDHVRAGTTWLPAYVAAMDLLRLDAGIRIRVGVETKLLDTTGALDLPPGLDGVELLLIADHQYPTPTGPVAPSVIGDALRAGSTDPGTVVRGLVGALVAAISRLDRPGVVAHPFSILPKMGLTEADIPDDALRVMATRCRETGTAVEVNEKWACPGLLVARVLHASGVELVAGSDAHQSEAVGRYWHVRDVLGSVSMTGVAV